MGRLGLNNQTAALRRVVEEIIKGVDLPDQIMELIEVGKILLKFSSGINVIIISLLPTCLYYN